MVYRGAIYRRGEAWGVRLRDGRSIAGFPSGLLIWGGAEPEPRFLRREEALQDPFLGRVVRFVERVLEEEEGRA